MRNSGHDDDDDDDVAILMCAQKLTDASLVYRTKPETKTEKKRTKNKNRYRVCSEETVPGQKPWSQSGGRKRKSRVERICETGRFEPGVKKRRSDESAVEIEVAGIGRDESSRQHADCTDRLARYDFLLLFYCELRSSWNH